MIFSLLYIFFFKICYNFNLISDDYFYDNIVSFIKNQGILFIKIAQIVSSRNMSMMPIKLKKKLKVLQDKCFFDIDENKKFLKSLNYELNIKEPLAAGSIASIYLVKNNYNDDVSILKLVNQGVLKRIKKSKSNLKLILKILKIFSKYNLEKLIDVDEFSEYLLKQLSMKNEARIQCIFFNIFKNYDHISVPKIYNHDNNIIEMEFKDGLKLDEFVKKYPDFQYEAISVLYESIIISIKNNILHGDFHFGNFLYKLVDFKVHIIILDFGVVCELNDEQKEYLLISINPKKNEELRINSLFEFLKSFNISLGKYKFKKRDKIETILLKLINSDNILPTNIYSCINTIHLLFDYIDTIKKKDRSFDEYLIGHLIENDLNI